MNKITLLIFSFLCLYTHGFEQESKMLSLKADNDAFKTMD